MPQLASKIATPASRLLNSADQERAIYTHRAARKIKTSEQVIIIDHLLQTTTCTIRRRAEVKRRCYNTILSMMITGIDSMKLHQWGRHHLPDKNDLRNTKKTTPRSIGRGPKLLISRPPHQPSIWAIIKGVRVATSSLTSRHQQRLVQLLTAKTPSLQSVKRSLCLSMLLHPSHLKSSTSMGLPRIEGPTKTTSSMKESWELQVTIRHVRTTWALSSGTLALPEATMSPFLRIGMSIHPKGDHTTLIQITHPLVRQPQQAKTTINLGPRVELLSFARGPLPLNPPWTTKGMALDMGTRNSRSVGASELSHRLWLSEGEVTAVMQFRRVTCSLLPNKSVWCRRPRVELVVSKRSTW